MYSAMTMRLGRLQIRRWKEWDKETLSNGYDFSSDASRFRLTHEAFFVRAPKLLKRSVGASFGFGGKLVLFHPRQSVGVYSEVYVHDLVNEHSLVEYCSSEFEAAMQNGEKSALRVLCDKKSHESKMIEKLGDS
ncbi:transport protein SEC31-like protein [Thalictrum thalictroides]|uniref:Transport protein SEC31-like protein n=1 Tax=Thalictrum thalictroides TaxID=46969 RepID=A0A7J6VP59_THATH|nr:transport protein SEC31-like protein [Thalictrum thalictroides]